MNIGVAGCSHSGYGWGNPWSYYMKNSLNCEVCDVSASGIGNEMMIEKIKVVLDNKINAPYNNVDFFIFQVTEPSRLVLGLHGNDINEEYNKNFPNLLYRENINCHRRTNGIDYITIKYGTGDQEINKLVQENYKVSDFFMKHILISEFNTKIKVFHTLMAVQNLFNFYNKKVLFFSWNLDLVELSKEVGYYDIIKKFNFIDGCVENFTKSRKIKTIDNSNIHYGSEEHKIIYEDFLHEHIKKFIENNIK